MNRPNSSSRLINQLKSINLSDSVTQLFKNPIVLMLLAGKVLFVVIAFTAGAQAVCH